MMRSAARVLSEAGAKRISFPFQDGGLLHGVKHPHVDLALALLGDIRDRKYPVGARLPTETDLCRKSGLSRYAVREAVQKLCDLGFVTHRAGIGTKVISGQPPSRYTQVMDTLSDLTRYAESTTFQIVSRERLTIDRECAENIRLPVGSK